MKKRVTACMTAVCLAATTVGAMVGMTGCGGKGSKFPTKDSDPNADIHVMLLANTDETAFYNEYFERKAAEYKIKIVFEAYGAGDYYQKLDAVIQQGNTPDIFYVRPNEILQYKENIFCLEQFKDTVATNNKLNLNLSEIYPLALDLYKYNDQSNKMDASSELWAFPKDLSTHQLGYNKTIVQNFTTQIHGANLPLPWELGKDAYENKVNYTWAEYRTMCEIIANNIEDGKYASDIPDIEILAKSFGGGILDTTNMKVTTETQAVKDAINYQHDLVTASGTYGSKPAADFENATQTNFQSGKVAFYGAIGSWEVGAYNNALGDGNWGVMPWPTTDGSLNWYGKITSAGYVVSNTCKNWQGAMEIAASFMTRKVQQEMVGEKKISLPINTKLTSDYLSADNDAQYKPSTRSIFIDVISEEHGFRPAQYFTFKDGWQKPLSDQLQLMWKHQNYTINASTQSSMQEILNSYDGQY